MPFLLNQNDTSPAGNAKMKGGNLQFGGGAPGGQPQTQGYNYALQQLQKSLGASNNANQAGQMQLQQQLQQNQGSVAQNLASRGLGNTTVAQTMQQAPLQTFNMGMAHLNDQNALRQMQGYQNLAQMGAQGGNAVAQTNQPYAQSQFQMNMMKGMQGTPNAPTPPGGPGGAAQQGGPNINDFQNLMKMQQWQQQGYQGPQSAQQGQQGPLSGMPALPQWMLAQMGGGGQGGGNPNQF